MLISFTKHSFLLKQLKLYIMKKLIYLLAGFLLLSLTNLKAQDRVGLSTYTVVQNTANEVQLNFELDTKKSNFIDNQILESKINLKEKFNAIVSSGTNQLTITLSKDLDREELYGYLEYIGVKPDDKILELLINEIKN